MVKKSGSKKTKAIIEKKSLLNDALKEIKNEIASMKRKREELEAQLQSTKDTIGKTQEEESRLRNKLTALTNKETEFSAKKDKLEDSLEYVKEKLEKIKKVESDLSDV